MFKSQSKKITNEFDIRAYLKYAIVYGTDVDYQTPSSKMLFAAPKSIDIETETDNSGIYISCVTAEGHELDYTPDIERDYLTELHQNIVSHHITPELLRKHVEPLSPKMSDADFEEILFWTAKNEHQEWEERANIAEDKLGLWHLWINSDNDETYVGCYTTREQAVTVAESEATGDIKERPIRGII